MQVFFEKIREKWTLFDGYLQILERKFVLIINSQAAPTEATRFKEKYPTVNFGALFLPIFFLTFSRSFLTARVHRFSTPCERWARIMSIDS